MPQAVNLSCHCLSISHAWHSAGCTLRCREGQRGNHQGKNNQRTGIDFINIHGKTWEAVEELHKVAVGGSENAACLRQLLLALRADDG